MMLRQDSGQAKPRTRLMLATSVAAAVVLGIAVLIVSPLALMLVDGIAKVDWGRLANIGAAYGAISALLSGVAVLAVAVSLLIQIRQLRVSQVQAIRMMQVELMKMLLNDSSLIPTSPQAVGVSYPQWRRNIYVNLLFKYLEMGYETGYISAAAVRRYSSDQFKSASIRDFWTRTRALFELDARSKMRRKFLELVDGEHKRASHAEAASTASDATTNSLATGRPRRYLVSSRELQALGFVLGIAVGVAICKSMPCRDQERR